MKNDNANSSISKETISYALGFCEAKLAEIARDFNQPEQEFREWVGILLLSQRQGISNSLSSLSRKTSKIYQALGEMEMAVKPHRKTRGTHTSRQVAKATKLSSNQKGFKYKGKHWTQLPQNKARLKKQTAKARAAYLVKLAKRKAA